MTHQFSIESEAKVNEIEAFLNDHAYLSGKNNPGEIDAQVLNSLKDAPDRIKHPNFFAWWWGLALFQEAARVLWGKEHHAVDKKTEHKKEEHKKVEHKKEEHKKEEHKKEEHKKEEVKAPVKKEEEELDLFGDDDEGEDNSKEVLAAMLKKKEEEEKKKKAEKKAVIAKSSVTFDVKAYEEGFDFVALGKKIKETINMDGLVWQLHFKILPVAYDIKKLQCGMIIEDDKVSADDVLEKIQELWPDDIQSCDIVEFNKV